MSRYIALVDGKAGAYGVAFPDLPGCAAMGATLDEAYRHALEALRLWAGDALADGETLPPARDMEALRADREVQEALSDGASFLQVPLLLDRRQPTRANISIDRGLLEAIDDAAAARGLTRSSFLASAAVDKIRQDR